MSDENNKNVLCNRNFFLLFQGTIVSNLGAILYNFALSFYILKITDNNSVIQGVYLGMCGVVFISCSFFGGVLADRWNKVKIIYGSDFIKGTILILALLPLYFVNKGENVYLQVTLIFIIGIINNIIGAVFSPASSALIPNIVEIEQLQQANSYFTLATSFESLLGIVLAAVLYAALSIEMLFLIVGICYILSGVTELFIKAKHIKKDTPLTIKNMFVDLKEAFNYLWPQKGIVGLILGILFLNFFFAPYFENALPFIILTDVTGHDYLFKEIISPEMWASVLTVMFSIGSIIMSFIIAKMKQKEKNGKWIKGWLLSLAVVISLIAISYYVFVIVMGNINYFLITNIVLMLFIGVIIVCINVPISVTLQKVIDNDKMAKVMSLINIGSQGLLPIAALIAGLIISKISVIGLLIFCGIGMMLTAVLIALNKKVNEL